MKYLNPTILAIISGCCFGMLGFIGVHLHDSGFSATNLLFWRFLIACPIAYFILIAKKQFKFSKRAFFAGGTFYFTSSLCFFTSLKYIGSGLASTLFYSFPIFTALFAFIIHKKKPGKFTQIALFLSIVGMPLLCNLSYEGTNLLGVLLALLSAIICASYYIACQKISQNSEALNMSCSIFLGNLVSFTILSIVTSDFILPNSVKTIAYILALSIIGTIIANVALAESLKQLSATKVAIFSVSEPITGLIIAVSLLNEKITVIQIIGGFLIILAGCLAHFDKEEICDI